MINFRYHLVSLVAVFLALAIGIVAGSTVIKESILDQTQQNLDRAEQNLKDLENSNAALRSELDQLNRRDDALDRAGVADFLHDRLTGVPVLMMKVDGVDDGAATALRQAFVAAGASYVGTVTFTDRLGLATGAEVNALQGILSESTVDPTVLRADLAARLGTLVTSVADSRPSPLTAFPSSTTTVAGTSDLPTTTTTLSPAGLASDGLRQFLHDLDDAGLAKLSDEPGTGAPLDLGGLRLVVMSGAGAKVDNALFVYPLLQRMVGGAKPSTLAVEATPRGSEVERGSFVGTIRSDGSLSEHVSTVDDAEWFVGRAAAVMALSALTTGVVGHYGVGGGAAELLPDHTNHERAVSGVVADDALVAPERPLSRAAASVGALTLLSRLTGFARVLVVTAVLGRGVLGDTYETANTVPNLLFELVAAGALQAVLVPTLVEVLDRDGRAAAERVAGAVLGCLAALLGAVAAMAAVAAPWIMRVFTSGTDQATYDAKVELGSLFLWFFLPQVLFYAVGLVASAVLNSEHRFNVPAVAPAVNNLVVLATYGLFWMLRDGAPPSLQLTTTEKWVLAGGTTLGVVAFTLLPAVAVARSGFHLRPRLDWHDPAVRTLGRRGAWAGGQLALAQVLLVAVLVLANGVAGGLVTWTFAFAFFLLPIALFAVPVATTMFPGLARSHQAGRPAELGAALGRAVRTTVVLLVGAAAAFAVLAWPIVRVAAFGDARLGGLAPLAHAVAAFAPGLVGYGLLYLLTRASYAIDDARTPFVASAIGTVAGVVVMIVASAWAPDADRAAALAGGYGAAYFVATVALAIVLRRRLGPHRPRQLGLLARVVGAGAATLAVMVALVSWLDATSRLASVVTLAAAGVAGAAVYAVTLRLLTGVPLRRLVTIDD